VTAAANNADATTTSEEDDGAAKAARRKEKIKRKKRRQKKESSQQDNEQSQVNNSSTSEHADTLPKLRPGAATATHRRRQALPPPESPSKRRPPPGRKQSNVTAYDLKEYLAKNNIVQGGFNILNVIDTANRMKTGDVVGGAGDQKSVDSGYSDTGAASAKPKNLFRQSVMMAVAKSANEVTLKKRDKSKRYEEVFESVNLSNEEFEAKIKGMKHLPPVVNKNQLTKKEKRKIPPTPRIEMNVKLALPPIMLSQQHALSKRRMSNPSPFPAEFDKDADSEFYKEIRFTYILLPEPADEFPRK
jgi:hypothetical protein